MNNQNNNQNNDNNNNFFNDNPFLAFGIFALVVIILVKSFTNEESLNNINC